MEPKVRDDRRMQQADRIAGYRIAKPRMKLLRDCSASDNAYQGMSLATQFDFTLSTNEDPY
jgi:hypothetical protein